MLDINSILSSLDPGSLEYEEWLKVGMAMKHEGCSVSDWESWSMRDFGRYKAGECQRKWDGFRGSDKPVTIGTVAAIATRYGVRLEHAEDDGHELDWDAEIGGSEKPIIRQEWIQDAEMNEPGEKWKPVQEMKQYLEALFQAEEYVGYVVDSWENDDAKRLPKKGNYDRTAGQLISALANAQTVNDVIGDWHPDAGVWVRFNPLDGKGVRDENVTDLRYTLVESDTMNCEKQLAIYRELELPCATIVHSGGKSVHAIVKIEAENMSEYRKRVDFLYDLMKKSGIVIDRQNRNPSRLSRLPGTTRNGRKQYLIDINCGKQTWTEWREWIEDQNDDLPPVESLADFMADLPPLAPEIIQGVLREGHKMLVSGSSKAGKSFLLQNLSIAVAEGRSWLGWNCRQGRVLYVNLELDPASCVNRFPVLYNALGIEPKNAGSIEIWNLRGKAMPMDKLAPRLIRRAAKGNFSMVIIDPIYKVITGDENAADQMAKFCNQFDRVCAELGVATVYCHHHSKGDQGQKKAHDRASGSGVFARDPDALLDMVELNMEDSRREQLTNRLKCEAIEKYLTVHCENWQEKIGPDEALVSGKFLDEARKILPAEISGPELSNVVFEAGEFADSITGWRIEGILREFKGFRPVRIWFDYPLHYVDDSGLLDDALAMGEEPPRRKKQQAIEDVQKKNIEEIEFAYTDLKSFKNGEPVTVAEIAEHIGVTEKTIRNRIKKSEKTSSIRFDKSTVFEKVAE